MSHPESDDPVAILRRLASLLRDGVIEICTEKDRLRRQVAALARDAGIVTLPDPFVWQCTQCGWTGKDHWMFDGIDLVCPQCRRLGYTSPVERVPLAGLPPKGGGPCT